MIVNLTVTVSRRTAPGRPGGHAVAERTHSIRGDDESHLVMM
jgi:hypothetical protein